MTQMLISRPAVHVVPELSERCDGCGAAAKVRVTLKGAGDLAFCGHHANRHAERIRTMAVRVSVEEGFTWRGATG
jgi:hypothetical protein